MNKLLNKVALITGGNSSIGLATAQLFAAQGAKMAISATNEWFASSSTVNKIVQLNVRLMPELRCQVLINVNYNRSHTSQI